MRDFKLPLKSDRLCLPVPGNCRSILDFTFTTNPEYERLTQQNHHGP